jgi:hypothetical protein
MVNPPSAVRPAGPGNCWQIFGNGTRLVLAERFRRQHVEVRRLMVRGGWSERRFPVLLTDLFVHATDALEEYRRRRAARAAP